MKHRKIIDVLAFFLNGKLIQSYLALSSDMVLIGMVSTRLICSFLGIMLTRLGIPFMANTSCKSV